MKKIISLAAVAALAGSLLSSVTDVFAQDFKGQTLSIGVWGGNESEEKSLDQLISNFEEITGAKVDKKVYTEYNTQIQADMIGRTAPDAFYVDASMFPFFVEQGALAELDKETFQAANFYETLVDTFSSDKKLYAIPKDMSTLAVYLNTDMFEAAGVSPDEFPKTWEDLEKWLPEFQAKLDKAYGAGKVTAMSFNGELARNLHLASRGGAAPVNEDGTANLVDKAVVDNLSLLVKLYGTGAFKTPAELGSGWNGEAFGTGQIAIMDEGNWVYQTLKDSYDDIKFKVVEMPTYKEEKGSMMFSVGWAKYAGTNKSELVDEWIKYVTGFEGQKLWVEGTGTLPSRQDVAEAAKITENADLAVHLGAWEYATAWQKGTTLLTIEGAYKNYVPNSLDSVEKLAEALKQANEQANSDISAGN
ncbi:ABC transporter substrate-binding protein [Tuanshanicoccus lijuaniae]|uniref:ABC transporter substrate-binding protein n=1 Tax=Aerococcaceae bacterium zg-1292 TaxID=2774330 RepID=UPI001BD89529|nr:extracellular solute-binding protein [Aerococcaceae bacterium zg-BR9]MBS4456739.1 extracellular solute-binding protein [Aerococcaceae bacterium zg-A91]MBS4458531.1 extracellular solute-binding protein [Aerococcaceae bacterium zg-BR33]